MGKKVNGAFAVKVSRMLKRVLKRPFQAKSKWGIEQMYLHFFKSLLSEDISTVLK